MQCININNIKMKAIKTKALLTFLICLSIFTSIAKENENLKIKIPPTIVAGSILEIQLTHDKILDLQIPQIQNFNFIDSTRHWSKYFVGGKKSMTNTLTIRYKSLESGKYIIPPMNLFTETDTITLSESIINVLPSDTFKNRLIDSTTMFPIIKNINEFDKESDILAKATIDKTNINIGDTIIAWFTVYNGLSNNLSIRNLLNISQDGLKFKQIQNKGLSDEIERVSSRNYKTKGFLTLQIIPTMAGEFEFDSTCVICQLSISDSSDLFGDKKELSIDIPKFGFKVNE